jgi:hypothetical protein
MAHSRTGREASRARKRQRSWRRIETHRYKVTQQQWVMLKILAFIPGAMRNF